MRPGADRGAGGGAADPTATDAGRVDALLLEVVSGEVRSSHPGADPSLDLLTRRVAEAVGARSCVLVAYPPEVVDGDEDAARVVAGAWRWPPGVGQPDPAGRPAVGDLVVSRGADVLGHLRLDPPPDPARRARLAPVLQVAAVLLGHRARHHRVGDLRRATTDVERALTEERRTAAVTMDLVRRRLEGDLHDGVQGDVVALTVQVALLEHGLQRPAAGRDVAHREHDRDPDLLGTGDAVPPELALVVRQAHLVRDRLRSMAEGAAPASLTERGLGAALREALPSVCAPGRLVVRVHPAAAGRRWPRDVETAAFFVCLEAVSNVGKHAPGAAVVVTVDSRARGLLVEIADDGPGMRDPGRPGVLQAMQERAAQVAASLEVRSAPGRGTTITLLVPF